tara:strand:+ start:2067 stop:2531 length:465 start_codon:yes stop_codon:yes gene_type:complete
MKKVSLDVWIQLIGMLSVLAGLVFVGLEMRQAQFIAIAGQQQQRAIMQGELNYSITEQGEDIGEIILNQNYSELSDNQKKLKRNIAWWQWNRIENDFYQYSLGLMPTEKWEAQLGSLSRWKNVCEARDIYDFRYSYFETELKQLLDDAPDDCSE